jgi:hypothetical protein
LVVSKPFSKYACQNMWSSEFYGWKIRLETTNQYHHWPTISSVHLPSMLGSPFHGNTPRRQCCQATPGGSEDQQPPLRQRKVGYGWLSGGFTMTFFGGKVGFQPLDRVLNFQTQVHLLEMEIAGNHQNLDPN